MFFGVAVGSAARRRRARTRSNTEVLSCGTTAHRARAEVAALIVQCWTNPHEKYHLFRSSGVEWSGVDVKMPWQLLQTSEIAATQKKCAGSGQKVSVLARWLAHRPPVASTPGTAYL